MKIIAINGSPKPNGNTALMLNTLLNEAKNQGAETKLIHIGKSSIHGCTACEACFRLKNQKCVFNDDIFNQVFAETIDADAIILGSPTYFADMTPEMKCFVDRAGYVAMANDSIYKHKIGAGIAVHRRGGAVGVQASLNHMFLISEMIIPGSTYWNMGVGLKEGEVSKDEEAMENMANLAQNICWLIKKIKD